MEERKEERTHRRKKEQTPTFPESKDRTGEHYAK